MPGLALTRGTFRTVSRISPDAWGFLIVSKNQDTQMATWRTIFW